MNVWTSVHEIHGGRISKMIMIRRKKEDQEINLFKPEEIKAIFG